MRDVVVTDKEYEKQGRLPYGELPHNTGNKKGNVGIEVVDLDMDAINQIFDRYIFKTLELYAIL